jgi:hypothetical protein
VPEKQPETAEERLELDKKSMAALVSSHQRLQAEGQWLWDMIRKARPAILNDLANRKMSLWLCAMEVPDTLRRILDDIQVPRAADGLLNGVLVRYILEQVLKEPEVPPKA